MLHETKKFFQYSFEIKDIAKATYVIRIEIFYDRSHGLLEKKIVMQELLLYRKGILNLVSCNI